MRIPSVRHRKKFELLRRVNCYLKKSKIKMIALGRPIFEELAAGCAHGRYAVSVFSKREVKARSYIGEFLRLSEGIKE